MRHGGKGVQLVEVDDELLVVLGVVVRQKLRPVVLPALGLEEGAGHLVAGEHGGRRAQLGAHVGDGGALGDGESLEALAGVFHYLAYAALDAQPTQDLKYYVLCRDHGPQRAPELHFADLGHRKVIRPAAHGDRDIEAARADGEHARRAAGGRVAVRAEQGLVGH